MMDTKHYIGHVWVEGSKIAREACVSGWVDGGSGGRRGGDVLYGDGGKGGGVRGDCQVVGWV